MIKSGLRILFGLLLVCLAGEAFGEVGVRAQVDSSNTIYVGDRFGYHIILDGVSEPGVVDMSPLSDYSPESSGIRTHTNSMEIGTSIKVSRYYVMSYSLMATKSGVLRLGGVDVTVGGQKYRTNEVTVNVVEPERTERIELEVELSKGKCYAGEPILMTVRWFIRKSIVESYMGAALNVPVFRSGDFYVEEPVRKLKISGKVPTFRVNGAETVFEQREVVRKGLDWVELSTSKVLIAKRTGKLPVEDAILSVDLAVGQEVRSFWGTQRESKRFIARAEGKVVEVLPVPEEGKPASFYGLVGKYSIQTSANITNVDVGQPIELTIRIGSEDYLKPVLWPRLEDVGELSENFRISEEREDGVVEGAAKVFKTTIRAVKDSVNRIPPIPLSYFDVEKGKYVTMESKEIALNVRHSDVVTFADAEMIGSVNMNHEVEAVKKGMAANYDDINLVSEEFSPLAALVSGGAGLIWFVPFAGFAVSLIVKAATYRDENRIARKRRRQALGKAVGQLKKVVSLSAADLERQGRDLVAAAMRQYVGDRFDKTAGSLTGMDCERIIAEATCSKEAAGHYREVMEECEASAYSGMGGDLDAGRVREVIEMLCSIDKAVKR